MPKVVKLEGREGVYMFVCPACKCAHAIASKNNSIGLPAWSFNMDMEKPTVSPSIKVIGRHPKGYSNGTHAPMGWNGEYVDDICHSFVKDGKIQFLSDCTHELAGKTLEIPEFDSDLEFK